MFWKYKYIYIYIANGRESIASNFILFLDELHPNASLSYLYYDVHCLCIVMIDVIAIRSARKVGRSELTVYYRVSWRGDIVLIMNRPNNSLLLILLLLVK